MKRCERATAQPTRLFATNDDALSDKSNQLMQQDINDDTNAITDGPLRIHGATGDPAEPPKLGTHHTPTHPLPTPGLLARQNLACILQGSGVAS